MQNTIYQILDELELSVREVSSILDFAQNEVTGKYLDPNEIANLRNGKNQAIFIAQDLLYKSRSKLEILKKEIGLRDERYLNIAQQIGVRIVFLVKLRFSTIANENLNKNSDIKIAQELDIGQSLLREVWKMDVSKDLWTEIRRINVNYSFLFGTNKNTKPQGCFSIIVLFIVTNIIAFSIFSCSIPEQQNEQVSQTAKDTIACSKSVDLGNVNLCLPDIEGMTECYSVPIVKSKFDGLESKLNKILAIYLKTDNYNKVQKLKKSDKTDTLQIMNGSFKIIISKDNVGYNSNVQEIEDLYNYLDNNMMKVKFDKLINDLENNIAGLSFDAPVIFDKYSANKSSRTLMTISKFKYYNLEKFVVMPMNIVLVKGRQIFVIYTMDYKDKESVKKARENNDLFISGLLKLNEE